MPSPETIAAQALHALDAATGGIVPPIHMSTTYARDAAYQLPSKTEYTRDGNPTYALPERVLAELEQGAAACLFSSGMTAATTAVQAALAPGAHVIASRAMYFGFRSWLNEWCPRWNVELSLVDATSVDQVRAQLRPGQTKLVWVETPANPTLDIVDLAALAEITHAAGARLAVDSTMATPVHSQPLLLGADLVMHSATKFLNGHSDVLAGALVTREPDAWWQQIRHLRHVQGAVLGPIETWLLTRGMRTLFVRVARSSASAATLAERLAQHPAVERVLYPGLPDHPNHAVAARQMHAGFGSVLAILVRGDAASALRVAGKTQLFARATSIGGVESLIEHRFSVEGPSTISPPQLLRLSVGLESVEDLWGDLAGALEN